MTVELNVTLAQPASAMAPNSSGRLGASAARIMVMPKTAAARTANRTPVRPSAAVTKPPTTAPTAIAADKKPYVSAPLWNVCVVRMGRDTGNS